MAVDTNSKSISTHLWYSVNDNKVSNNLFEFNVVDLMTIGWINQIKKFKRMREHNLFESIEKLKPTSF